MVVQLSPRVEAEIERLVASGQYADANEVSDEGVRLLTERERARFLQLQALVRDGFDSDDTLELTPERMDEIEHEAEEAALRGETPSPHVRP